MISFDSVAMKGRIEDAVNSFLEAVSRPWPAGDPRGSEERDFVLGCFAETLAHLLIGDSFRVVWQEPARRVAALWDGERRESIALGEDGADAALARVAALTEARERYAPLDFAWYSDGERVDALSIAINSDEEGGAAAHLGGRLVVLRDKSGEGVGERREEDWEAVQTYLPGLKILYLTLGAVMKARASAEAAAERLAFDADVRELVHDRGRDIRDRLEQTVRLLERVAGGISSERLDAVERAVVSVLQELLGTGWTVRELGRAGVRPSSAGEERALVGRITVLTRGSLADRADGPAAVTSEARRLLASIESTISSLEWLLDADQDNGRPHTLAPVNEPLHLLPLWVRLHELARPLSGRNPPDELRARVGEAWDATVAETLPLLARYLEIGEPDATAPGRRRWQRPSSRNWMRLWFCLVLLREERARALSATTPPLLEVERDTLRAELAFVLRESLRFACFGERRDFFFQAATYARALRLLVEQHAQWIVELPGDYTRRLLHDISQAGGPNHYLPAEHLQHVLEVYIAGHFLLSVRLKTEHAGERDWPSIAQVLSEFDGVSRGEPGARAMRQAFSLAALFHDVGHLLFPDPQPGAFLDEPRIRAVLGHAQKGLAGAARALTGECLADLRATDFLGDESLVRWFSQHEVEDEPNHGLLSAWYLWRAGNSGNNALRAVLKKAVRAVLLHGVSTLPITKEDPLAALLVLCNEVFEWDPRRPGGTGAIGRSFHVMAAEAQREPRDLYLKTQGLSVAIRDAESGALDAVLDPALGVGGAWPEIHVVLQNPQRLDVPVYWLWVGKAQNLGRIEPLPAVGWAPSVVLKSRVATVLRHRGLTTRTALELAGARIYGLQTLRNWLAKKADFREEMKSGSRAADRESAHLRAGGFPLDATDARTRLREIRDAIDTICLEIDARGTPR